jgi:hypothetical protein
MTKNKNEKQRKENKEEIREKSGGISLGRRL